MFVSFALLLAGIQSEAAEAVSLASAVSTFQQACLSASASLTQSRSAITQTLGGTSTGTLPPYTGRKPFELYDVKGVEVMLRPDKERQFGCFVALALPADVSPDQVVAAVGALPGLIPAPAKGAKNRLNAEWSIGTADNKGRVYLKIELKAQPQTALLNFEAKGD